MGETKIDFEVVVRFFLKWKFHLIIVTLVAGIGGAIFSGPFFITPKYQSTVIFYPTNPMSASKALIAENTYSEDDYLSMGEDEEAEQMLQILQSDVIIDAVKKKFDLMKHYNIDPKKKWANTVFRQKFLNNVKCELTKYTSIKITVRDVDRFFAARLANDIAEEMDSVRNSMQKKRAKMGLEIVKSEFKQKEEYLHNIVDSLKVIAGFGVLKYEQQSEVLTTAYAQALQSGNQRSLNEIKQKLDILAKYGPIQEALSFELEYETEIFVKLRAKLKEIKMDASTTIPYKYIVEHATVAERKSYPVRWLITVSSAIFAFFITFIGIILFENLKKIKKITE